MIKVLPTDASHWTELSQLLDELLDLAEDERCARLAEIRQTRPEVAAELSSLLAHGDRAGAERFLTGALPAPTVAEATLAGQRLGAYLLETQLGQGGGGSVWRARREDGRFEGTVAIKLLHLSLLGRAGAERFRREGHILARLTHPHIARLLDAGVTPGGQPYLVLELVQGVGIDRHCDALSLSIDARLALFDDVLAAVAHAHTHGAIHRDLKPGNILVNREGQVKLLDFGVAKLLDDEAGSGESTELTREGGRALTPEYAAPEQWRGEGVTTATDVYALGVLLYQLLCGQHPTAPASGNAAEALRATLETEPVPTSRRLAVADNEIASRRASSPQQLQRKLAGDLDTIVMHALRKAPGERYATVAALAEDLRRCRNHEPITARPDSLAYRATKFVRRHRGAVASSLVILLAILAGLIGTITQAHRADQQARLALQQRDRAVLEQTAAEATSELIGFLLSEGGDKPFTTAELLARADRVVDSQFSQSPVLRARLGATVADLYVAAEASLQATDTMRRAVAAARAVDDPLLLGDLQCRQAGVMSQKGQYEEARSLLNEGYARLAGASGADPGDLANCLRARAHIALEMGDAQGALVDAERAVRLLPAPRPGQRMWLVSSRTLLADVHGRLGDYPHAISEYDAALADLAAMGRERTSVAASVENNLGVILMNAGLVERAGQVLEQSQVTTRGALGDDAVNPAINANLAGTWLILGRTADAVELLEAALAAARREGNTRSVGYSAGKAAAGWCAAGNAKRCAERLKEGRRVLAGVFPAGHSVFGTQELTAAQLSLLGNDRETARRQLQQAIALYDAAPERNPKLFVGLGRLARLEQQLGHAQEALALSERAVVEARRYTAGLTASEWLGSALLARATVLASQQNGAAARAAAIEAVDQLQLSLGANAPSTREARVLLSRLQGNTE